MPTPIELSTKWIRPDSPADIIGWPAKPILTFIEALVIKKLSITMLDHVVCRRYLGSDPNMEEKMMCGHITDGETIITVVFNLLTFIIY